ncbi:MAG: hypothetical protein JWQ21_3971 [Herminiimonas sp.]|nr:hypothetical protein [Herminiimonas sp.]
MTIPKAAHHPLPSPCRQILRRLLERVGQVGGCPAASRLATVREHIRHARLREGPRQPGMCRRIRDMLVIDGMP